MNDCQAGEHRWRMDDLRDVWYCIYCYETERVT